MPNWRLSAACIGSDPELFYVNSKAAKRKAKGICYGCPVRRICLKTAVDNERAEDPAESPITNLKRRYGIFGGVTASTRWAMEYPEAAVKLREETATQRRERRRGASHDLSTMPEGW